MVWVVGMPVVGYPVERLVLRGVCRLCAACRLWRTNRRSVVGQLVIECLRLAYESVCSCRGSAVWLRGSEPPEGRARKLSHWACRLAASAILFPLPICRVVALGVCALAVRSDRVDCDREDATPDFLLLLLPLYLG